VRLAREMYDSGDYTVQQIAQEFGVTRPTICGRLGKDLAPTAPYTRPLGELEQHRINDTRQDRYLLFLAWWRQLFENRAGSGETCGR
jgi:hypothetical protein